MQFTHLFCYLFGRLYFQIALLIILRGYQMNPPCPPFECAHMWYVLFFWRRHVVCTFRLLIPFLIVSYTILFFFLLIFG